MKQASAINVCLEGPSTQRRKICPGFKTGKDHITVMFNANVEPRTISHAHLHTGTFQAISDSPLFTTSQ